MGFFPNTLNKLNDLNTDNLNDVTGLTGPGDVNWAFQWDFSIAPGASAIINKSKYVELTAIPEPTAITFLLSAVAFVTLRRSRRVGS